ncbi:hypothetical protein GCM10015535_61550 [Streptomyces gelaticus]|uniref:STAS domain-containing protein n=1 Tax=Streptomyces gelaticus TaxID=285446 RepID=A0ABQ2W7K8_9ACTN|nr:hypothetical protein [Streptomyces gelaticus]GGV95015.1 hypothetical protein GCM10015535_61550 [Streptomyces gelaticus]
MRGRAALGALSERFGLHLMQNPALAGSTVTLVATADTVPVAGVAPPDRAPSERVAVLAAQGAIDFTAVERVLYALDESRPRETGTVVLDLRQVTGIGWVAQPLLSSGLGRIAADGVRTAVADPGHPLAPPGPGEPGGPAAVRRFATREEAVALVYERHGPLSSAARAVTPPAGRAA